MTALQKMREISEAWVNVLSDIIFLNYFNKMFISMCEFRLKSLDIFSISAFASYKKILLFKKIFPKV